MAAAAPLPRITEDEIMRAEGVLCAESLNQFYTEIRNFRWIQSSPIYRSALEEWERKAKLLGKRVERKKKQSGELRNEIYNLVGFFSVFQGVLLTAVAQSNLLLCKNWWSPFILSALASIVTIAGVLQKFVAIGSLEKTIHSEETTQKAVVARVIALRRDGPAFKFSDYSNIKNRKKSDRFLIYMVLIILALVSFTVVFLVSHPLILCRSGNKCPTCPTCPT